MSFFQQWEKKLKRNFSNLTRKLVSVFLQLVVITNKHCSTLLSTKYNFYKTQTCHHTANYQTKYFHVNNWKITYYIKTIIFQQTCHHATEYQWEYYHLQHPQEHVSGEGEVLDVNVRQSCIPHPDPHPYTYDDPYERCY